MKKSYQVPVVVCIKINCRMSLLEASMKVYTDTTEDDTVESSEEILSRRGFNPWGDEEE